MDAISNANHSSFASRSPLIHADSQLNSTAGKAQSLWNQLQQWIGQCIRDLFFLPIPATPSFEIKSALKKEEDFATFFWDPAKPVDLNFPHQEKIRKHFEVYDQPIKLRTTDGKSLEVMCRIIESKEKSEEKSYNCIQVLGSLSTISNNITSTYPFLAAYLDARETDPTLSPARYILLSQYDMKVDGVPFRPRSLDEAGLILKKALDTLSEAHGEIDQLVAHSLGSIIFAASLKSFETDSKAIPQHIHFERAVSSIEASSRNYYGGALLHFLAKLSGWSLDIGQELADFDRRIPNIPCLVSGVKEDFYFPGLASLHEHPKIKQFNQVKVLVFDPPRQLFHVRSHHGLRADLLNGTYLVDHSDCQFCRKGEHLAAASLRHSRHITNMSQHRLTA